MNAILRNDDPTNPSRPKTLSEIRSEAKSVFAGSRNHDEVLQRSRGPEFVMEYLRLCVLHGEPTANAKIALRKGVSDDRTDNEKVFDYMFVLSVRFNDIVARDIVYAIRDHLGLKGLEKLYKKFSGNAHRMKLSYYGRGRDINRFVDSIKEA